MVIMVFKNINQIQKKKKNYILTGLACSIYSNLFFCKFGIETETQEFQNWGPIIPNPLENQTKLDKLDFWSNLVD